MSAVGDVTATHDAIRAWYRLEKAFDGARKHLQSRCGITGEQLAILRIVNEKDIWLLAELRHSLSMHPATLGQILGRMKERGLVSLDVDPHDRRRRTVTATPAGRELCRDAPLIGPVRLRSEPLSRQDAAALTHAFTAAIDLFGLQPFTDTTQPPNTKDKSSE